MADRDLALSTGHANNLRELDEFDELQRRAGGGGLSIVSTLPFHKSRFWNERVHTLSARRTRLSRLTERVGIQDPGLVWRLLRAVRRADVVLLNGGERIDLLYLALVGLMPWIRTPHVIVDAHWQPADGWAGRLQRWIFRLGLRALHEVQPHSPEEIAIYEERFGIPRELVNPLPWSTSLTGYEDVASQRPREPVIVSGGMSYRDYPTLLGAVEQGGWRLRVGLPQGVAAGAMRERARRIPGVEVVGDWSFRDYWQQVANATVFAMPMPAGLLRCTADQTILNAMSFGTVVVATDAISSRLYIRDGENGFLVPPGDIDAWTRTLKTVFSLPAAEYERISRNSMATVQSEHREDQRLARTLLRAARVALRAARPRAGAQSAG